MRQRMEVTVPREKWVPAEKPFRVLICRPRPYPANWMDDVECYASLEEAMAVFNGTIKGAFFHAAVHEAMNPDRWQANGWWKQLARRKPRPRRKV